MPEQAEDATFTISIGSVSFRCADGRTTNAINEPDTASGTVAADEMARSPADWAAPAAAAFGNDVVMRGEVVEALPGSDGSVALSLRSGLTLSETVLPPMVNQNLTPQEIVYAAAREAGFSIANIHIEGLDDRSIEPMWVLAPVDGVQVNGTVRVGVVEFTDATVGQEMLRRFSPPLDPVFSEPLADVDAFARVAVVASVPYDAEQEGLALIDTATAWLTTRLRYSWSHAPDGRLEHYERAPTRVTVERRDGVGVLAVDGQRRWWRKGTTAGRSSGQVTLSPGARWTAPPMPAKVAPGDRQALIALQRAATVRDPVQRVAAFWESVEFYVGDRGPEAQFADDEIAAIVERAASGLESDKAARVGNVLRQWVNEFSIMARLHHVLAEEDVPVTADDDALLRRLRRHRNKAVHGSGAAPEQDDIDRAVAFLSRAIIRRWHHAAAG